MRLRPVEPSLVIIGGNSKVEAPHRPGPEYTVGHQPFEGVAWVLQITALTLARVDVPMLASEHYASMRCWKSNAMCRMRRIAEAARRGMQAAKSPMRHVVAIC